MVNVRPYAKGDDVLRVWRECGLVVPQNDPDEDIRRKLRVNAGWFLVAEIDGEIVATCMAGYEGHRGWINYLGVRPQFQRKGIASALMLEAERLLGNAGCPKINLQVRTTNPSAIAFYESLGFSIDAVTSMGKRLGGSWPSPDENPPIRIPPRAPIDGKAVRLIPCDPTWGVESHEAVLESIPEISPWMEWCHSGYTIDDAAQWINAQPAAWASGQAFEFMIIESRTGRLIGACGVNQINHVNHFANLGYWIRTSRRGNGFASEAAKLAAAFGFRELSLTRIEIVVAAGNSPSQRAAEKAGATREGLLRHRLAVRGKMHDAIMFSLVPTAPE